MTPSSISWLSAAPQVLIALAAIFVPGALVVRALGARGMVAAGAVPAVSAGLIGVAAIGVELTGRHDIGLLAATSLLTALVLVVVLVIRRPWTTFSRPSIGLGELRRRALAAMGGAPLAAVGGVALAAGLLGWRIADALIGPAYFSQHFDVVFHLNAVRSAMDGAGSSLSLGRLMGETGMLAFYPAAWHDLAALVAQAAPAGGVATIPVAVSAVDLVIAAVVWPLGCVALVRAAVGARPVALLLTGALAAGFGTFPLRLLDWGVLFPFFFGMALVPGVLAVVIGAVGPGGAPRFVRARAGLLAVVALVGLGLAHTSAVAIVAAFAVTPAAAGLLTWTARRRTQGLGIVPPLLTGLGGAAALVVLWWVLRPKNGFPGWEPTRSLRDAVLAALAAVPFGGLVPVAVPVLAALGCVAVVRRPGLRWVLGIPVVAGVLFVTASGAPRSLLRAILVGPWYEDVFRVAPLLVLAFVLMAAIGGDALVRGARIALARLALARRRSAGGCPGSVGRMPVVALSVGLLLAIVGSTQLAVTRDVRTTQAGYRLDEASPLITPDELALLSRIAEDVPVGEGIAVNPWNGSAFAYAFADRPVLAEHLLYRLTGDRQIVAEGLRDARTQPQVCEALGRLGIRFALDFGGPEVPGGGGAAYPGLAGLADSDAVAEVDRQGDAVLYRITACG